MGQFIIYTVSGFCIVWINLLLWGFTNGPANAIPYFALLGGLLLFIVASGIALFWPRIAACIAFLASALVFPWPLLIAFTEHDASGVAMCGAPPLIAAGVAVFSLWRTRQQAWLAFRTSPHWAWRLAIAILPIIAFVLYFNAELVLQVVFRYPFS